MNGNYATNIIAGKLAFSDRLGEFDHINGYSATQTTST